MFKSSQKIVYLAHKLFLQIYNLLLLKLKLTFLVNKNILSDKIKVTNSFISIHNYILDF